jgi:hypothetical protein
MFSPYRKRKKGDDRPADDNRQADEIFGLSAEVDALWTALAELDVPQKLRVRLTGTDTDDGGNLVYTGILVKPDPYGTWADTDREFTVSADPIYEANGAEDVPADGSLVVEVQPGGGGNYWLFDAGAASASKVEHIRVINLTRDADYRHSGRALRRNREASVIDPDAWVAVDDDILVEFPDGAPPLLNKEYSARRAGTDEDGRAVYTAQHIDADYWVRIATVDLPDNSAGSGGSGSGAAPAFSGTRWYPGSVYDVVIKDRTAVLQYRRVWYIHQGDSAADPPNLPTTDLLYRGKWQGRGDPLNPGEDGVPASDYVSLEVEGIGSVSLPPTFLVNIDEDVAGVGGGTIPAQADLRVTHTTGLVWEGTVTDDNDVEYTVTVDLSGGLTVTIDDGAGFTVNLITAGAFNVECWEPFFAAWSAGDTEAPPISGGHIAGLDIRDTYLGIPYCDCTPLGTSEFAFIDDGPDDSDVPDFTLTTLTMGGCQDAPTISISSVLQMELVSSRDSPSCLAGVEAGPNPNVPAAVAAELPRRMFLPLVTTGTPPFGFDTTFPHPGDLTEQYALDPALAWKGCAYMGRRTGISSGFGTTDVDVWLMALVTLWCYRWRPTTSDPWTYTWRFSYHTETADGLGIHDNYDTTQPMDATVTFNAGFAGSSLPAFFGATQDIDCTDPAQPPPSGVHGPAGGAGDCTEAVYHFTEYTGGV